MPFFSDPSKSRFFLTDRSPGWKIMDINNRPVAFAPSMCGFTVKKEISADRFVY